MTTYEEFLTTSAVPRETIDRFLDEADPTWARFDGEVGYTLGRYLPKDGIDDSWTISTAQDNGQRTSWMYAGRDCRINTYGNSFTQCHQVSDGETWQEYLAAHLGEPVRNFGMGGFGTYQAYRRLRRTELSELGGKYVILYIWGDDHCRSIMRCRHAATHRVWDHHNGYLFHGNFWANVEMDLDTGRFVERECLLPTAESLYRMCDADFMVESLRDDLMVMLYGMERFDVDGDPGKLKRLADHLDVDGIDDSDGDRRIASVQGLKEAYGFAASRFIVEQAEHFVADHDKELLICLLCPTATEQVLRGQPRYDQGFANYLRAAGHRVFDMNEVHRQDFGDFSLSVEDYRKRYWMGHYSPAGNHFFAHSLKDTVIDWLEPKPRTYRGDAPSSADFDGYLPTPV
ncbi:MAG: hypothetical protein QGI32_14295 [Candidatus Latescibacteria bacterium]|nr:hypothetical protein [Candidatus Latescibacterota bacterium]